MVVRGGGCNYVVVMMLFVPSSEYADTFIAQNDVYGGPITIALALHCNYVLHGSGGLCMVVVKFWCMWWCFSD